MIHILTHNDLDGYAAGYVVSKHFGEVPQKVYHHNYDQDFDIDVLNEGDVLTITDYSIPPEKLFEALEKVGQSGRIIWCDHHHTAITNWVDYVTHNDCDINRIEGIRDVQYCGAMLTYLYLEDEHLSNMSSERLLEELDNVNKIVEMVPRWLRLVDAWDTWKLNSIYRIESEYLNIALKDDLSLELIDDIASDKTCLTYWIQTGYNYNDYKDKWAKAFNKSYGFDKIIPGHLFGVECDVLARVLTIGNSNSTYFGDDIKRCDVCITQCFDGKGWRVSLYSNKDTIDVSICAKIHGGGGHKGASGCYFNTIYPPVFAEGIGDLIKEIKEKENE